MRKDTLDEIFERELKRLDDLSKKGPLELEDLRKLDILTRSLKQYVKPEEAEDPMENVSSEDLIKLIKSIDEEEKPKPRRAKKKKEGEYEQNNTQSRPKSTRAKAGRKKKGVSNTVAEG